VVQPGEAVYLAMKGDAVNQVDPDGRMFTANWRQAIQNRERNVPLRYAGWFATFGMGPIYMMALQYAGAGALLTNPFALAAGGAYFAYMLYYGVNMWRTDPQARKDAFYLTSLVVGLNQIRGDLTVQDRLKLLALTDLPSALVQVISAQGGPLFATVWIGHASYPGWKRVAVYMTAYATNSYGEVFGQGLVVYFQELAGVRDPTYGYGEQMGLASTNMLVGNFCFYGCMAFLDYRGKWNTPMKTVGCKNFWAGCRFAARTAVGTAHSPFNSTADRFSDGLGNAFFGLAIDRYVGQQILGNLPLKAVHGLFFPDDAPLVEQIGLLVHQTSGAIGSEVSWSPTVPVNERGMTGKQFQALLELGGTFVEDYKDDEQ
jgi:hypothetical protein